MEEASKNHPGSTTSLFGSSLEIPLVDSALAAKYATFPFMVMKFLSAILLAPGLHRTCLLGIIIQSAWSEASRPSRGFAPEQTRIVVSLSVPSSHSSFNPPMNDLFYLFLALSSFQFLLRRKRLTSLPILFVSPTVPLLKKMRRWGTCSLLLLYAFYFLGVR